MSERWAILIVGGNDDRRDRVRRALAKASEYEYDFAEATTGAAAVSALDSFGATCVVLHDDLPDMDGPQLLQVIAEHRGALPPVILVTASVDRALARQVIRAGAMDYLGENRMNSESLTRALENAVERHALLRERDAAVDRLRESDARATLAMEAAGTGLWEWNVVTGAVTWSAECYAIFGISTGEFDGTADGFGRLVHPEDVDRVWQTVRRAVEQRTRYEAEFRIVRPNGELRWVANLGRGIYGDDGAIRVLGTITDITQRKAAETALRTSEERFRVLVSTLPQVVWETDAQGLCVYQAPQWEQWTGQSVETSLGTGWLDRLDPEDRDRTSREWHTALQLGSAYESSYRLLFADGSSRWCVARANALRDPSGAIVRWVGTTTEVEAIKRAERAARESQAILQSFYDSAPMYMGIAELDEEERTVAVSGNRAMAEFFATSAERLPGRRGRDLGTPAEVERLWVEAYGRSAQSGVPTHFEFEYPHPRGLCWLSATVGFIGVGPTGRPRFSFVTEDVTDRKRAEALVADAARHKDEFIAMLAHELRNPLAPVRTAVALLQGRGPADPLVLRCANVIERQAAHMARLLDDLLDVSRLSRGTLVLERGPVVLQDVIDAAIETTRPQMEQRQHDLERDMPEEPVFLDADGIRLTQVFSNLLNNAVKFTPPRGRIVVTARLERDAAVVVVRDTGRGIAKEDQSSIFDLFAQVKGDESAANSGLGIGLALVRQVVEMHGGSVGVSSEGARKGSEFTVRLPCIYPASPVPKEVTGTSSSSPLGLRVLVADDHADAAEMLATWLESAGCEVRQVDDGISAVREIERFRPDVALVDLTMPGIDGYEVSRRVRQEPWGSDVTLVALTGWGRREDRSRSILSGFDHHLVKPTDLEGLFELLRHVPRRAQI